MIGRALLVGALAAGWTLGGCAATLQTRKAPDEVRTAAEAVLRNQGFKAIEQRVDAGAWHVTGEFRQSYPYLEKAYRVSQQPTLRPDPASGNVTVFEEQIDPSQATTTQKQQEMVFRADVAISRTEPERRVAVTVTGPQALKSDKYREIRWIAEDPPSALQLEERLGKALRQILAD